MEGLRRDGEVRMVVFHGDNRWAKGVMKRLRVLTEEAVRLGGTGSWLNIRHVNLGLLPTSRLSWEAAIDILDEQRAGWIHVHENVDVRQLEQKKDFVVQQFQTHLNKAYPRIERKASCLHIEQVKTYAPGVMHCVFDMRIEPILQTKEEEEIENG